MIVKTNIANTKAAVANTVALVFMVNEIGKAIII
jgi:hypothetical protein